MKYTLLLVPIFAFLSCKQEIQITEIVTSGPAYLGDTLTTIAVVTEKSKKADFEWSFVGPNGTVINPIEQWDNVARWIPTSSGVYEISATAKCRKEVSILTTSLFISTSDSSLHNEAIIGSWIGTCTTPWWPVYEVQFDFFSNGHYIGNSSDANLTATYYGDDGDYPQNTYSIFNTIGASANGTIDIYFVSSNTTVTNQLEGIQFYNNYNGLKFYFKHFGTYGPLEYDLIRQ
ncbi:MAG: hypothetical protein JNJ99_04810 [Crocinitomicaceae bacterium]|nr:hypothetical protein [Crocinitomicaceae bacterium]